MGFPQKMGWVAEGLGETWLHFSIRAMDSRASEETITDCTAPSSARGTFCLRVGFALVGGDFFPKTLQAGTT